MKKWLVVAGIGVVALLISGVLVGAALAEGPQNGKNGVQQTFISKLARILGIQEEQLKTAVKQAQGEMVDDAQKAGKLNQDQADRLKERIDKEGVWGPPNIFPPQGNPHGKGLLPAIPYIGQHLNALAEFLVMKPAELIAELGKNKSLAEIAQEHGKTREQLKQAILSYVQKQLDEAVAKGKLTKEKADAQKQRANAEIDKLLDAKLKGRIGVPQRGFGHQFVIPQLGSFLKTAADFLGVKPGDLQAEMKQGKTLAQIAKERGKTPEQLKETVLTNLQTKLDEAVANGKLTKEKAAKMRQKASEQLDNLINTSLPDRKPGEPKKPGTSSGKS